jgi:uncharacterized protein (DUF58 family)
MRHLDPAALMQVGSLELRARGVVEGLISGMHRSPQQGFSVEFAQHRPYSPGDDPRHLDWKVMGRTDKLYLKQYVRETNLDLTILVDASGSMHYGSGESPQANRGLRPRIPGLRRHRRRLAEEKANAGGYQPPPPGWTKYDHAATLAASLTYLALGQGDRVSVSRVDDAYQPATRYSSSPGHLRAVCAALEADTPAAGDVKGTSSGGGDGSGGGTDLGRVLDQLLTRSPRRGLIVLISDLLDEPDKLDSALAKLAHARHDLILLHVLDPAELALPFDRPSDFIGLEGEGKTPGDPDALRDAYQQVITDHLRQLEHTARRHRFDYHLIQTHEPPGTALAHYLARRAALLTRHL